MADKTPIDLGARKFADMVSKNSGGKIKIGVYSNSALGDNRSMIESLQRGTLDFCTPAIANLAAFTPATKLLDMPFLFNSSKQAERVLDGKIGQNILSALPQKGLIGLAWFAPRAGAGAYHKEYARTCSQGYEGIEDPRTGQRDPHSLLEPAWCLCNNDGILGAFYGSSAGCS